MYELGGLEKLLTTSKYPFWTVGSKVLIWLILPWFYFIVSNVFNDTEAAHSGYFVLSRAWAEPTELTVVTCVLSPKSRRQTAATLPNLASMTGWRWGRLSAWPVTWSPGGPSNLSHTFRTETASLLTPWATAKHAAGQVKALTLQHISNFKMIITWFSSLFQDIPLRAAVGSKVPDR